MAVGCSCAGCLLFLNILFNQHHCSLSSKSCCNATVGLCYGTVAILCLSWRHSCSCHPLLVLACVTVAVSGGWLCSFLILLELSCCQLMLALPPHAQHSCCCRWLIVQFFRVIKIILLPATAGIAVTCTASVLHQTCITRHTIVLLLSLSLLVDCYFSKKRDYPTAAVYKASQCHCHQARMAAACHLVP